MDIPKWPKGLPYPISWIRALALTSALVFLVKSQLPLRYDDSIFAVLIGAWVTVPFLFEFFRWAIALISKNLLTHLPAHPKLDPFRQYLTNHQPNLSQGHWKEGLNAFIIAFVAFAVSTLVVSFLLPVPGKTYAYDYDLYSLRRGLLRLRIDVIPIGMLIISAYLYQYDLWARSRRAAKLAKQAEKLAKEKEAAERKASKKAKKASSSKPKKHQPPADPIEIELNQMSAEFGATSMRPVRKAEDIDKTQWYVFRSGSAEGPYTREQLWLAQRITARSNVRREGETDWTRAGEIPELADSLNTKA